MGYPSKMASEVNGVFEEYRCESCHINIDSTKTLTEAHIKSPHNSLGCITCHDTVHFGHKKYETNTKGFYGCRGKHQVTTEDINPPSNPSFNFLDTYLVINYTSPYSFYISKRKWFYPQSYDHAKTIYPYNFIDPITGNPSDIPPNKRYWICLKCHFTSTGSIGNQTSQYWILHTDRCYDCHKYTKDYPTSTYLLDPHSIEKGINTIFYNCESCHSGINDTLSTSIHSDIGCSCHSIIHISKYNGSSSWISLFRTGPGIYSIPKNKNVSSWLKTYYYNIYNNTNFNVTIYPIYDGQSGRYVDIYYVLRYGDASLINDGKFKFLTCFNCHFINDPGFASIFKDEYNNLIPISNESLMTITDPHSITESKSMAVGSQPSEVNIMLFSSILAAISVIIIVIIWSGKRK